MDSHLKSFTSLKLKCSIPSHSDQKLKHICMSQGCEKEQRLLCDYCIQNHKHNDSFIKIKDLETKEAHQIYNWPVSKNKEKYLPFLTPSDIFGKKEIQKESESILKKTKEVFENFREKIEEKITMWEKEVFIQVQFNLKAIRDIEKSIEDKLEKLFNVDPYKQLFQQFDGENLESEIEKIDKITNYPLKEASEQNCMRLIQKREEANNLNSKILEKMGKCQNKFLEELNSIHEKTKVETQLLESPSNSLNSLNFISSTYGSSKKSIKIQGKMVQFLADNNWKMIYTEPFHRNQEINLRFKLSCKSITSSFFTIGVITKEDTENKENTFAETGTQLALTPYLVNSKAFKQEGQKFYDIFYDGIEAQIDININKNTLVFSDKQQKCKITNEAVFEDNAEWRLLISAYGPVAPTFIFI